MTRHPLDPQSRHGAGARLGHYLGLERRERHHGPHAAIRFLSRLPRAGQGGRLRAFAAHARAVTPAASRREPPG
ncbi:hypothetical protein [Profundibacterium mesophilum]|uniref:Uncharacterized protein n=1 Tax=Profundibacterium mesophilum KAUST100406-0324 TaxID=1037889 RepID=A0A921NV97_9RHOB|nr:hypothetical protein [Profundibacterium mesophilum]KAF0675926.1 hypothetical protein PMES_01681 [Profundibacterium mesophilum KAUST100406-0324]